MSTKECLFCVKIPLGEAMIYTFDLFEDQEIAKFIAIESGELLKEAWFKDRFTMCGRSRIGLLSGSIYISSIINDVRITQKFIANELGVTKATVRHSYFTLLKILPDLKKQFEDKLPVRTIKPNGTVKLNGRKKPKRKYRKHPIRCIMCKNIPNAEDFVISVINYKTYRYLSNNPKNGKKLTYAYIVLFNAVCKFNDEINLRIDNLSSHRKCSGYDRRYKQSDIKTRLNDIHSKVLLELKNGSYEGEMRYLKAIINV